MERSSSYNEKKKKRNSSSAFLVTHTKSTIFHEQLKRIKSRISRNQKVWNLKIYTRKKYRGETDRFDRLFLNLRSNGNI